MSSALGEMLPLAIGVAISPIPIVAVILMLFSARAKTNGPAFLVGWLAGLIVVGIIVLAVSDAGNVDGDDDASTVASLVKLGLGLLLIAMAVRQWRGRPKEGEAPKIPKWMAAIDSVTPVKALGLGALLSGVNPKNLALTVGAAVAIAQAGLSTGDTAIVYAVFVILGSASIAVPVIYYLAGGASAAKTMESWKSWLLTHNAAVMAVLLLVFGFSLLGKGIGGLFD
jgi:hypothetical protein